MSNDDKTDHRWAFVETLSSVDVQRAARSIWGSDGEMSLTDMLELAHGLASANDDEDRAALLAAERQGYEGSSVEIPMRRRVTGYASPFPVRAIGLLDPEEIFLANREKFAQVTLTIGQSINELETALDQIQEGGVLALRVPASEVSGEAVLTDGDAEVYIYILPREIQRVVDGARKLVLDTLVHRVVEATLGPRPAAVAPLPTEPAPAANGTAGE